MISKALVPIAGLGARMGSLCRAVPKALLPLPDRRGNLKPIVHHILSAAAVAGVQQAALVVSPDQRAMVERYLAATTRGDLPEEIVCIVQPAPAGFGEAVTRGAAFLGGQPFVLLLGDHVYLSRADVGPCVAQVVGAFAARPCAAMIGMQEVGPDQLSLVGVARGEPLGDGVYRCTRIIEKPDLTTARTELVSPGLGADSFLAHCGIYVFSSEILACLEELSFHPRDAGNEVGLTEAQAMLLDRRSEDCFLFPIAGRALDTGTPAGYIEAFNALRQAIR